MRPTYVSVPIFEYGVPGSRWAAGYHTGRDYQGFYGSPLRATRAGRVVFAGYHGGWGASYGYHVVVETSTASGAVRHLYAHQQKIAVYTGEWVAEGQLIGYLGNSGHVTGAHCHYEERHSPFTYWDHRRPTFDVTPSYNIPILDASAVARAVKEGKTHVHGSLIKAELAREVGKGFMNLSNDTFGWRSKRQFAKLQKKWYGHDLGGIPGQRLLTRLGNQRGKWTTIP